MFYRVFDDDEFQHAHTAWLIWNGHKPYVDFFEHHLPLYHYLVSPVFIFGSHVSMIFVLRGLSLAMLIISMILICRLAGRLGASLASTIAASMICLFAPIFIFKMLEARPGVLSVMLFVIELNLIFTAEDKPGSGRMMLAGALAGAMTLASQKFGLIAVGCVVAAAILHGLRPALFAALGGTLSAVLFVAAMFGIGAMEDCWNYVVQMNLHWKRRFSPAGYASELFLVNGVFLSFGIMGLLRQFWDARWNARQTRSQWALLALTVCAVLTVLLAPVPFRQVYLPLFPLLVVGVAWALDGFSDGLKAPEHRRVALIAFTVFAALPGARRIAEEWSTPNRPDLERMRAVENISDTDAPVFDGRCLMFYRPHVGFYPCMHDGIRMMLDPREHARNAIDALRRQDLPLVICDYRVQKMPSQIRSFISENYLVSPMDTQLRTPGFRVDRARLGGRRGGSFRVVFAGNYRVLWEGGGLSIDGNLLENGDVILLDEGEHQIRGRGFVDNIRFERMRTSG